MKCDVEYDRECGMARKRREYVAGYRKGNCKQIIKEKCYRRRIGKADKASFYFCETQGKGRAKGRPRKVTQRSFMDCGWWMVDILSLMLYTKFGCHPPTFLPTGSLLISRIKPSMDQVR